MMEINDTSSARFAFLSPSRFPILITFVKKYTSTIRCKIQIHLTDVAIDNANGAWNVIDPEVSNTDCVASATGPIKLAVSATNSHAHHSEAVCPTPASPKCTSTPRLVNILRLSGCHAVFGA